MTIEMHSPEELFSDPEMIGMAKGTIPLPKVKEARAILKEKLKNDEPIAVADIEKVNTPFRRELMMKKTKELCSFTVGADPKDEQLHMMMDMFDYLALDWVYSDVLRWEGSLADSYANKIKAHLSGTK